MINENPPKSILIVEDEPAIREVCRRVLSTEGFVVDVAEDGEKAQEILAKKEYSLMLIDIRTPVIDGRELYVWILQEKPALINRVIFTTGDLMEKDLQQFIGQSGRPFLPKPFTSSELLSIINKTLNKNTGSQE